MPSPILPSAAVLIGACLWGLYWLPVRYFEDLGLSGPLVVAILPLPAAILSIFVARFGKGRRRMARAQVKLVLLIGFLVGAAIAAYGVSISQTSVVRATLLFYLLPVWATILGLAFLNERATLARMLAIALGLLGLFILTTGAQRMPLNAGDALAVGSGVIWAIATTLLKRAGDVPIWWLMTAQLLATALVALGLGWALGSVDLRALSLAPELVTMIVVISIVGLFPANLLIFWASQFLSPGRVGILLMAEIVTALATAAWLLPEEAMGLRGLLAVVFILCAAIVEFLPLRVRR